MAEPVLDRGLMPGGAAARQLGPDLLGTGEEVGPALGERLAALAVKRLVVRLEAGDDVLVAVVDKPLDDLEALVDRVGGGALEADEHLDVIGPEEVERGLGIARTHFRISRVPPPEPAIHVLETKEVRASLLERTRGLQSVGHEPPVVVRRRPEALRRNAEADAMVAADLAQVPERLGGGIERNLTVGECRHRAKCRARNQNVVP